MCGGVGGCVVAGSCGVASGVAWVGGVGCLKLHDKH